MYSVVFKRTAVAGDTAYQLSNFSSIDSSLKVYINGNLVDPNTSPYMYTLNIPTRTITFSSPFVGGEAILIRQGNYYYHEVIRKVSAVFGTLFNEIYIKHRDANQTELSSIKVPLAYGPAKKYLARLTEDDGLDAESEDYVEYRMTLPRMSFELTGLTYDSIRQKNRMNKIVPCNVTDSETPWQYESVPYNLEFTLFIMTKRMDESLQIIEQIIPNFAPSIRLPLKLIDALDIVDDVSFKLESVMPETNYEGAFEEIDYIMWTLSFVVEANLYRATNMSKLILPDDVAASPDIEYVKINTNIWNSDLDLGNI